VNLLSAFAERLRSGKRLPAVWAACLCLIGLLATAPGWSQTAGMAGIQGTVADESGAVVPNATITATNIDTGIATTRTSTSAGVFNISPIVPGTYTVKVAMPGFSDFVQNNLVLDAMKLTSFNVVLKAGATTETVVVNEAPPSIDTNSATLGGIMENKQYANLPILANGQQRDPTAFATLMPGAQGGARAPIIGGTANYSTELYLEGLPLTVATQQGDNRVVFNSIAIDSIDQFQLQTSAIPPEYQGAGVMNFTIKRGGNQFHGSANYIGRNTVFDTWTYTQKRSYANTGVKPNRYENQNEVSGTIGGPVPFGWFKDRVFFFQGYMRYHGRAGTDPGYLTVPTTKMRTGDFSELLSANGGPGYVLYDPLSTTTCTANTGKYCRYPFGQSWSGAVDTSKATNVIPTGYISPIAQYMQKYLPTPSNSNLQNNWLGGMPSGYDNWISNTRVDVKISDAQTLALVYARGTRKNAPYTLLANPTLPIPYIQASSAQVDIDLANVYHTYTINSHMVNTAKFGFLYFGGPPITAATDLGAGNQYSATAAGITNLPSGQASDEFPGATFSGSYAPTKWTGNGASQATYTSKSLGYTYGDNVLYQVGRHSFTFGAQLQLLEANADTYDGHSGILTSTYSVTPTAGLASSTSTTSNTGFSYASYLIGGVGNMATTIQSVGVVGGRYHTIAPYVNDDYKVNSKLTLNIGLRWDYLPPYHEAADRWSFLNPALTNTITGNAGMMQFAGYGAGTCNCRTPVQTWWKNWGPRLGLAYSLNDKTVIHAGFGIFYSHGGGVGGRAGAATGTGQLGYAVSDSFAETTLAPAFWLNNGTTWTSNSMANTTFGGTGHVLPTPTGAGTAGQLLNTGNYVSNGVYQQSNGSVGYADPYVSGRAPTFNFFTFGVQRVLTNTLTLSVNYSGSESHFIPAGSSAAVGQWANQLDPKYMVGLATTKTPDTAKANILSAQATTNNIAAAQSAMSSIAVPYSGYAAAGNASAKATIQQMLLAFPQYAGVSNTWGFNIGNNSYHSLQVSLLQREWKGLSFQAHYTFSKNLGDDGTYRSGYDIPAAAIDAGGKSFTRGRADRSWTSVSIPHNFRAFGVYQLPFGKGKIGSDNFWASKLGGGWLLSGIFSLTEGTPLAITPSTCYSTGGTCMPNINPNFTGKAKTGNYNLDSSVLDANAFIAPAYYGSTQACTKNCTQMFGNAPRSAAYGLRNPNTYNLDMGLKRTFPIYGDRYKFIFEANCTDVTHVHNYGGIGASLGAPAASSTDASTVHYSNSAYGVATTASGKRDWQFGGHITF